MQKWWRKIQWNWLKGKHLPNHIFHTLHKWSFGVILVSLCPSVFLSICQSLSPSVDMIFCPHMFLEMGAHNFSENLYTLYSPFEDVHLVFSYWLVNLSSFYRLFLAHLSRRFKWAFLTKICLFSAIVVVINFSPFHLLLKNHWANFNQTWHKASLGEGDSSLFKWRALPFSNGR